jgi:hypothetical protein
LPPTTGSALAGRSRVSLTGDHPVNSSNYLKIRRSGTPRIFDNEHGKGWVRSPETPEQINAVADLVARGLVELVHKENFSGYRLTSRGRIFTGWRAIA